MITGVYDFLEKLTQTHVCPAHPDKVLSVAQLPGVGLVIRCAAGHYPSVLQYRKLIWSTDIKEVDKMTKEEGVNKKEKLPAIYEATTGELASATAVEIAIKYAQEVGIKPERGHIVLYHGKPWIAIEGWYFLLRQKFPQAKLVTRPLDFVEREQAGIEQKLHAWKAQVYEKDGGDLLAEGYGYSRDDDPLVLKSPVEQRWPWRLAEKRAEEDAIRKVVGL